MRLLLIHSDYIEYEAKDDTPVAEEGVDLKGGLEEALTVFTAVESIDEDDMDSAVKNGLKEIRDVAEQLGVENIMIYPYAHLSDDLADPNFAVKVLESIQDGLNEYNVKRAPFGWYKAFKLSCKGHPLSELSRSVKPGEVEEEEEEEVHMESTYKVLTTDGEEMEAESYLERADEDTSNVIRDELGLETSSGGEEPPHIQLMQEKEFVGYDELSDPGNFRWYPRGKLIRDQLMNYVDDLIVDYGGMPVETPIMYDLDERCIHEHSDKFGERQYRFESGDRKMMLRFAACFGQFSIMRDMHITAADLPLRIYEMSTYSFRREQKGELSGLKRLRTFTMPDMHSTCSDMDQAKTEFENQALLGYETADDLGLDYVPVLRSTRTFYDDHREWMDGLVEDLGRDCLVEVIPERKHYWSVKIDFAAMDAHGVPMENPTVQIDVESAERFDIEYFDEGERGTPVILHYSPTGSIERAFAAMLESISGMDTPRLPTWLSPTQVRFIPINESHVEQCLGYAEEYGNKGYRVDIDDRDETVGRRIRRAEQDWVPYIVLIGDDEIESGDLSVRIREEAEEDTLSSEELRMRLDADNMGLPKEKRYTPLFLSENPSFE